MKQDELIKRATCCMCHRKLGQCKSFLFYVVEITRYGLNLPAINRQAGLEMMLGNCAAVARVMGPDEDMAKEISNVTVTVCDECGMKDTMVALLNEKGPVEEKEPVGL